MSIMNRPFAEVGGITQMIVPDLWQQEAVSALRAGFDVVVQAPTGAGKTLIFEIWANFGKTHSKVIYTVPTRALANDKLAEWRAKGWNVGIATGDLSENLDAPVLVATLETQKNRLIRGEGPALLVIDEYQMLGDLDRGLNYELAIAMAPMETQLLLLSGSVANPQDIVKWLQRLGRKAVLIKHDIRPVPLDEVYEGQLDARVPQKIKGYWPRLVAKALAEDLGPILIFAPRRQAAEQIARELARTLPAPNPLKLTPEQRRLAGEELSKLLKSRIAYHHSGLSYGARAGVVEPLAKAGQLRVVVATMGLAAGINFSLRSVILAGDSYKRGAVEQMLQPDEILQMFGRAGRRGIDETGYVIVCANQIGIRDAHACYLSRNGLVDWSALLCVMSLAEEMNKDPFVEAIRIQGRLFSSKAIPLGVEFSIMNPDAPCGLNTDCERARHVRKKIKQILNSAGRWQVCPTPVQLPAGEVKVIQTSPKDPEAIEKIVPALTDAALAEKLGFGNLVSIQKGDFKIFCRSVTVADILNYKQILLAKWMRRLVNWNKRQTTMDLFRSTIVPLAKRALAKLGFVLEKIEVSSTKISFVLNLERLPINAVVDEEGVALWNPPKRFVMPEDCSGCSLVEQCQQLSSATGVALLWKRLGLIDPDGRPTIRGKIVSFFHQGDGLAIAAALEDHNYPIAELVFDLANLEGSFRFCGDENRWAGRLAMVCKERYGNISVPGYLENGVPPDYGAGAEQVIASVCKNPNNKYLWINDLAGIGDIDRLLIEWRSLLRQIVHSPDLDLERWMKLKEEAFNLLNETESPTLTNLPPLEPYQTMRVDHRILVGTD